jgi:Family of unknown function (DUF6184)
MNIYRTMGALAVTTTGLLVACGGSNQDANYPAPGVANSQAADKAVVDHLASARCEREKTCNNVGPDQKYASHSVCMDQMRGNLANDLNAYNCPRGIDMVALDGCMQAIRSEECSHPMDTLTRVDKCRTGALCLK